MRVILTKRATERLDIRTAEVTGDASGITVVPYAAVLYDKKGDTWVYTNPEPLTFVRGTRSSSTDRGRPAYPADGPARRHRGRHRRRGRAVRRRVGVGE